MKHKITTRSSGGAVSYEVEGDECLDLLSRLLGDMELTAKDVIKDKGDIDDLSFLLCETVAGAFFDRADQLHKAQTKTA